jgi:formylglycine-generating enzyme
LIPSDESPNDQNNGKNRRERRVRKDLAMQFHHRYALGLVFILTSCGQILGADEPYVFDPEVGNTCGDGNVGLRELCDDGNLVDGDGCDSNCTITACRNGIVTIGEPCDDGNLIDTDECTNACQIPICGDGIVHAGEQCDDANATEGDGCNSDCTISLCGNGIIEPPEECDDGNTDDGDGCDSNCTLTACGNGIITATENCDDGNLTDGDTCASDCLFAVCGDGIRNPNEECDDGNETNNDGCLTTCRITPASCVNLLEKCGPMQNESCCASLVVDGGTFNRSNDPIYPATLSSFRLDRFEVTVGRFRKFVEAYPTNKPAIDAGAHPLIEQSGWKEKWNDSLTADQMALRTALKTCGAHPTWTDSATTQELLPINCVSWYEAFAFCAWDNARLATDAEWNYAAVGGNQQRYYPWSNPPSAMLIAPDVAIYDCRGDGSAAQACALTDILAVGSLSPGGDGLWGHANLGGNMFEWLRDSYEPTGKMPVPCTDCADITTASDQVVRGGGWASTSEDLMNTTRLPATPDLRDEQLGFRCARPL